MKLWGMHEIPSIITERVDDILLLLEQRQWMHLPALIDQHFPAHGNWQGLSLGVFAYPPTEYIPRLYS